MKKLYLLFLLVLFTGCASVTIPNYIKDKNPYKKTFYADFDQVLKATNAALEEMGWEIATVSDPAVFEHDKVLDDPNSRQTLLISDVRPTALFLGTRYARINVFLRTGTDNATEMELRYLTVNSTVFKNFHNYNHDIATRRIFKRIEELLG